MPSCHAVRTHQLLNLVKSVDQLRPDKGFFIPSNPSYVRFSLRKWTPSAVDLSLDNVERGRFQVAYGKRIEQMHRQIPLIFHQDESSIDGRVSGAHRGQNRRDALAFFEDRGQNGVQEGIMRGTVWRLSLACIGMECR